MAATLEAVPPRSKPFTAGSLVRPKIVGAAGFLITATRRNREALAFGKALYDIRIALGLSVAELAMRAALTDDDIERIEEGGTEPTIPLLRRLAAALNGYITIKHSDENRTKKSSSTH